MGALADSARPILALPLLVAIVCNRAQIARRSENVGKTSRRKN
jgi:hypothetical protein